MEIKAVLKCFPLLESDVITLLASRPSEDLQNLLQKVTDADESSTTNLTSDESSSKDELAHEITLTLAVKVYSLLAPQPKHQSGCEVSESFGMDRTVRSIFENIDVRELVSHAVGLGSSIVLHLYKRCTAFKKQVRSSSDIDVTKFHPFTSWIFGRLEMSPAGRMEDLMETIRWWLNPEFTEDIHDMLDILHILNSRLREIHAKPQSQVYWTLFNKKASLALFYRSPRELPEDIRLSAVEDLAEVISRKHASRINFSEATQLTNSKRSLVEDWQLLQADTKHCLERAEKNAKDITLLYQVRLPLHAFQYGD